MNDLRVDEGFLISIDVLAFNHSISGVSLRAVVKHGISNDVSTHSAPRRASEVCVMNYGRVHVISNKDVCATVEELEFV